MKTHLHCIMKNGISFNYYQLDDVLPTIYEKSEMPLILLLDGVTDVRNFGSSGTSPIGPFLRTMPL